MVLHIWSSLGSSRETLVFDEVGERESFQNFQRFPLSDLLMPNIAVLLFH